MYENNYLAHYGIKGQKWGIRRFQNKDGSRTPAGKKRYDEPRKSFSERLRDRRIGKIRDKLIEDSKNVTAKAEPGKHRMVEGKYERVENPFDIIKSIQIASHIVDDQGKVKFSYMRTPDGDLCFAAGKEYMDKNVNLKDFFKNTKYLEIMYDVYD